MIVSINSFSLYYRSISYNKSIITSKTNRGILTNYFKVHLLPTSPPNITTILRNFMPKKEQRHFFLCSAITNYFLLNANSFSCSTVNPVSKITCFSPSKTPASFFSSFSLVFSFNVIPAPRLIASLKSSSPIL